jgi:peroxin-11B
MRLGKPIEHLQAALRVALAPGPAVEQILTIGRQVAYVGYLTYDMFIWVCRISYAIECRVE